MIEVAIGLRHLRRGVLVGRCWFAHCGACVRLACGAAAGIHFSSSGQDFKDGISLSDVGQEGCHPIIAQRRCLALVNGTMSSWCSSLRIAQACVTDALETRWSDCAPDVVSTMLWTCM